MEMKLVGDTISKLHRQINLDIDISQGKEASQLQDLTELLMACKLNPRRRIAILGSYMLLYLSMNSHRNISLKKDAELSRSLLDGDYLFGLYVRWLIQYRELELLSYLTPIQKKMQIQLAEGLPFEEVFQQLFQYYQIYLSQQVTQEAAK